jgi:hypothetical protein
MGDGLAEQMPRAPRPTGHGCGGNSAGVHAENPRPFDVTGLKAPFPAFGGKRKVAALVWSRLGNVANFVEPFCNSAAVLLARPHPPRIETVNDVDCYISGFWRAVQRDPEAVAEHADWPVNECDLHARHRWLVLGEHAVEFRKRMREDPEYYDPKVAGWWVWGACCWIGSGWCVCPEEEPVYPEYLENKVPRLCGGNLQYGHGIHAKGEPPSKRPLLAAPENAHGERTHHGVGVHKKVPKPSAEWEQLPQLSSPGSKGGVHAGPGLSQQMPLLTAGANKGGGTHSGIGVHAGAHLGTCAARRAWLVDWFSRLRDRLRTVRVCCGHWKRVCDSPSVTTRLGLTGLFLDPPYCLDLERMHAWVAHLRGQGPEPPPTRGGSNRADGLYAADVSQDLDRLVAEVHGYCAERGADPQMRIALSGYAGEHEPLEALGWECVAWKSSGGYANRNKANVNAARERIWFSPHCLKPGGGAKQAELF